MLPKETIEKIIELCEDARTNPQYLTFHTIAEWCEKQMEAIDLTERFIAAHKEET